MSAMIEVGSKWNTKGIVLEVTNVSYQFVMARIIEGGEGAPTNVLQVPIEEFETFEKVKEE